LTAFTLIEILIVVMILAILGSVVVAHFNDASEDSKESNLQTNLQSIRAQLELYKMQHNDAYPTHIEKQLTNKTDVDGNADSNGAYGPYIPTFPANPYIDDPVKATGTTGRPGEGWRYNPTTGVITPATDGNDILAKPFEGTEGLGGQVLVVP
jgi:general secretion pathway protein G